MDNNNSTTTNANCAAILLTPKLLPLHIGDAPYPAHISPNELVVRNAAVAINPVDWKIQVVAPPFVRYPCIMGQDTAGVVVQVGENGNRFQVGDRVVGQCGGGFMENAYSAFQEYTILNQAVTSKIPDNVSFEEGCVIPLGLSTSVVGLYASGFLELPSLPSLSPSSVSKVIIIWGGSSSIGCNAIQLAVASGYEVYTTCSPKHFPLAKKLGATQTFDYHASSVIDDMVKALEGRDVGGTMDCITTTASLTPCSQVVSHFQSGKRLISITLEKPADVVLPDNVQVATIFADLRENPLAKVVFDDYLYEALRNGNFIAAPSPVVIGHGLDYIQEALERQKIASGEKIVVTLGK